MSMTGAGEVWYLPDPTGGEGTLVLNAHASDACAGRGCALHGPSLHWARDMPLRWKHTSNGGYMTRVCPHGAEHDDPDDAEFRGHRGMPGIPRPVLPSACDCPCSCDHEPPF